MLLEPNPTNACFGCGGANPRGMKLSFELDEAAQRVRVMLRVGAEYQGGPGFVHGGIIATLLDEVMGKISRFSQALTVTAELNVQYLRPIPIDEDIIVEGWGAERKGRNFFNAGEIRDASGAVLARGNGRFVEINRSHYYGNRAAEKSEIS
jgi:uncharacterized protein (TIGR00369 family)